MTDSGQPRHLGKVHVPALEAEGILSELLTFTYSPDDAAPLEDLPTGWPTRFEFGGHAFRRVGYNPHSLQVFYISDSEHTAGAEQWFGGGAGI
ncbi:MAG: hypothetical protein BIFFINMI_01583 [Phycisphaerae bacterium]|nr:hypothetical protein [Phycisphaerae bacterium]